MIHAVLCFGFIGAAIFVATTIIGGIITPNYSHLKNPVSELTADGARYGRVLAIPYSLWDVCIMIFFIGVCLTFNQTSIRVACLLQILNAIIAVFAYTVMRMDLPGAKPTLMGKLHTMTGTTIGILLPVSSMLLFVIGF